MGANKILLVDDDPIIIKILVNYMKRLGLDHDTARDGLEAMKKLQSKVFDIVFTDIMMPHMDGMELLKYIRENYPKINVIVITSYGNSYTFTNVIKAGATDFIIKPIGFDGFEAKLNRIIRERELIMQLEVLAESDGLTGLYNRAFFDSKLLEEVQRATRQHHDTFLLLVDVDYLKTYNDELGHQAGDRLLQKVGEVLQKCTRENVDWPCRYGGDEFAVILNHVNWKQASRTAKRIIDKFNEYLMEISSLSIGVARFIRWEEISWQESICDCIKRCDVALYQAKVAGRNRYILDNTVDGRDYFSQQVRG
jgi:diguanylate cyclase (GGDEF)-like protein